MRITAVEPLLIDRYLFVQVHTDAGITGLGESGTWGYLEASAQAMATFTRYLIGQDPLRIEHHWQYMYRSSHFRGAAIMGALSALDIALWDIKGKHFGVPVYELLGGRVHDRVRVYANGWSFRCVRPDEFAAEARRVVDDGYTALKLYPLATAELDEHGHIRHVSHRAVDRAAERRAVERVRTVREAVGPDVDVMVDMSAELTTDAVIRIGRQMERFDVLFFEEPVDPFDVEALKKVSDQVRLPIAVGERLYTRYAFRRVLELHAADVLQPDVTNTGGILETKKIAAMAEAYNARVAPHNCAGPVATAAALQVDACTPNVLIQELYPYRIPEHFEIVADAPELDVRDGHLPVTSRPGLGVTLVEDKVKPFVWAVCRH
jgi:galactonate dehydratase